MTTAEARVSGERLRSRLERLSEFGRLPQGGITRPAWSKAYEDARAWLETEMRNAGLNVWTDPAGNVFGGIPAEEFSSGHLVPNQKVVVTGSHIDTVPQGGMFDGALGVIAGLECLQVLSELSSPCKRPLLVASWMDEEGYYGSLFGSRAFTGRLNVPGIPMMTSTDGDCLVDAMARWGFETSRAVEAKAPPGSVHAYVELHIEQGPYLERADIPIGAVKAIVGVRRSKVVFVGRPDHAGTMPMPERQDAFIAAADYALRSRELLKLQGNRPTVMNIGNILVQPGAANVVPSRVELIHEFRDSSDEVLEMLAEEFKRIAQEVARKHRVVANVNEISISHPVPCSPRVIAITEEIAGTFGLKSQQMYSAAGHDVLNLATVAEVGMIFIPSRDGRSHCPEEVSDWGHIEQGANVLLHTLLKLAN
jgi:N-carbamoyl-L-amino-acid hydrolase